MIRSHIEDHIQVVSQSCARHQSPDAELALPARSGDGTKLQDGKDNKPHRVISQIKVLVCLLEKWQIHYS